MAEARYRRQKGVVVSPDYADNTKFADERLHPHPGTDGALGAPAALAPGHLGEPAGTGLDPEGGDGSRGVR